MLEIAGRLSYSPAIEIVSTKIAAAAEAARPRRRDCATGMEAGITTMKLLSFVADGKECFGAAVGDGVVTLNDKIDQADLRAALAAGALEAMRRAAKDVKTDRELGDIRFLPVIPR